MFTIGESKKMNGYCYIEWKNEKKYIPIVSIDVATKLYCLVSEKSQIYIFKWKFSIDIFEEDRFEKQIRKYIKIIFIIKSLLYA